MGSEKSASRVQEDQFQKLRKELEDKDNRLKELKRENQKLVQQQLIRSKQNKQLTVQTLVHMNYPTFTCINCQNFYDQTLRPPMMVCKFQHTVCEPCLKQLLGKKRSKCLECSQKLENLGKNRMVLNLITNKGDLVNWMKQKDAQIEQKVRDTKEQSDSAEKIIVHLCRFPRHETCFQMNYDSLLKTSPDDSWHTVRAMQKLPSSQSQITFKIIQSVHNSIIVGITTQTQEFQKGFIPSNSLAFHLNNGHIYDSADQGYKWRSGGTPVPKNTNPSVQMNISFIEKKIKWKVNKKLYAETKISENFCTAPVYVFVAIYHKGDMIVLNK